MILAVLAVPGVARAQAGQGLVIESPPDGAVTAGTPRLVVGTSGVPAGIAVSFVVRVDGHAVEDAFSVTAGGRKTVSLGNLASGPHTVVVAPATASSLAGDTASFEVRGAGFNPIAIVVVLALVALILFYRRRVLEPFTDRYERPPPAERP